ncbi:MAG: hypothetical protein ACLTSX_06555 [Collinsella sp.]
MIRAGDAVLFRGKTRDYKAEHHGSGPYYAQDARRRETGRDPDRIHRPRGRSVMSHDEH